MKKFLLAVAMVATVGLGLLMPGQKAFAEDCGENGVQTAIIHSDGSTECYVDENKDGGGIYKILTIVVNILTIGVGVLGTLGIVIAGTQYLTSSGNDQQMAKAKKRIGEVVIGLIVYGVMWVVLQWLIPGGVL